MIIFLSNLLENRKMCSWAKISIEFILQEKNRHIDLGFRPDVGNNLYDP